MNKHAELLISDREQAQKECIEFFSRAIEKLPNKYKNFTVFIYPDLMETPALAQAVTRDYLPKLRENISKIEFPERILDEMLKDLAIIETAKNNSILLVSSKALNCSDLDAVSILVHELTHTEQMTSGRLAHGEIGEITWEGITHNVTSWGVSEYFYSPWEVEAYKVQTDYIASATGNPDLRNSLYKDLEKRILSKETKRSMKGMFDVKETLKKLA